MSRNRGRERTTLNIEEQVALRLPIDLARRLRPKLKTGKLEESIWFEFPGNNKRVGSMFIERPGVSIEKFKATLCDLPTVVETQKTLDRSTYYKSGDIGQVILVEDTETAEYKSGKKPYDDKYRLIDGLSPPTKNIRARRFRKVPRVSVRIRTALKEDMHEAEQELARLIKGGSSDAIDTTYEEISVDDVEDVFENPSGALLIFRKNAPPVKTGDWSEAELLALPTKYHTKGSDAKVEEEAEAEEDEEDADGDGSDISLDLEEMEPEKPKGSGMPEPTQPSGRLVMKFRLPVQLSEADMRDLRMKKVEFTNEISRLQASIQSLKMLNDVENDRAIRDRRNKEIADQTNKVDAKKLELKKIDDRLRPSSHS